MLAKQQVSPKIIYTTHSAGCLPEDLGNGVRLVKVQEGDLSSSQVVNKFWAEPGGGFQPLLIGMGASTLAFFPTRRAVLVEGPADMLLYPALFREISEKEYLGFQFVPGLSTTGQVLAPLIPGNDHHIVYLADGDEGGLEIAEKLQRAGVDKTRIVHVRNPAGTALEIEDYIDSRVLLRAANRLLALFHPLAVPIQVSELANGRRMAALKAAYSARSGVPVPKVELAYELLRLKDEQPTLMLHDSRRRKALANILARLIELFVQG
jgi:predicted ATP-dependent endonuclease of OLD family